MPVFIAYQYFFAVLKLYAAFTLNNTAWGTRDAGAIQATGADTKVAAVDSGAEARPASFASGEVSALLAAGGDQTVGAEGPGPRGGAAAAAAGAGAGGTTGVERPREDARVSVQQSPLRVAKGLADPMVRSPRQRRGWRPW